jgi:hypothetical protein
MNYAPTQLSVFKIAITIAQGLNDKVREATSDANSFPERGRYYLSTDFKSGFGITDVGELVGVFSTEKGRGDRLISEAKRLGAKRLDCFEGYLTDFYARHGFREVYREANWTEGEPDVVYMLTGPVKEL